MMAVQMELQRHRGGRESRAGGGSMAGLGSQGGVPSSQAAPARGRKQIFHFLSGEAINYFATRVTCDIC